MIREEIKYQEGSLEGLRERQLNVNEILFSNGFISEEQYEKVKENCASAVSYRI